jgi:hypothetical protein
MSAPVKIARAMIRDNETLLELVGARVYPTAAIPQNAPRPLIGLRLVGIEVDRDLDGEADDRLATVNLLIAGDSEAEVAEILAVLEAGELDNLEGTYAETEVRDTQIADDSVTEISDEPLDHDFGQAFSAEADLEILYV